MARPCSYCGAKTSRIANVNDHAPNCRRPICLVPGCTLTGHVSCRGLCSRCYQWASNRVLYCRAKLSTAPKTVYVRRPDRVSPGAVAVVDLDPDPGLVTQRRPGDPNYRCVWCMFWRCDAPCQQCSECKVWYDRRAAQMPEYRDEDDAA